MSPTEARRISQTGRFSDDYSGAGISMVGSASYYGEAGDDEISGNTDPETVYGGTGKDTVNTFGGDDVVDVADGGAGDFVDCHIGNADEVWVDARRISVGFLVPTDTIARDSNNNYTCERVHLVT